MRNTDVHRHAQSHHTWDASAEFVRAREVVLASALPGDVKAALLPGREAVPSSWRRDDVVLRARSDPEAAGSCVTEVE
jgi:hypothetical protein